MADYKAPLCGMRFAFSKAFEISRLWAQLPMLAEVADAETAAMILEETDKVTTSTITPLNRSDDKEGCQWNVDAVSIPVGPPEVYRTCAEGDWTGVGDNPTYDDMGIPKATSTQVEELVSSANLSFGLYPILTVGVCLTLSVHAGDKLEGEYLPNIYAGIWAGSMCLTGPHAGTDLGITHTRTESQADGSYKIDGAKAFTTSSERDLTGNIIHLVLAKLPDAPVGPKGIPLLPVPKVLVNAGGPLSEENNLGYDSVEYKMRIKASTTCVMNFDGATGWLVSEVNKGLAAVFITMDYGRLGADIQGLATGERSYQNAIEYARERIQSHVPTGPVAKDKVVDPIVVHPGVCRMLLVVKALNENGHIFSSCIAVQLDTTKYSEDVVTCKRAEELVTLLTPVAKAFLTDMGLEIIIHGQQTFGDHGFIHEWGQEQLVRDCRIVQIYGGTNGIQVLDSVGHKIIGSGDAFSHHFTDKIKTFVVSADEALGKSSKPLAAAVENPEELIARLLNRVRDNPNEIGTMLVEYLHVLGYTACAYMWASMARTVLTKQGEDDFYASKLDTACFYSAHLLLRTHSLDVFVRTSSESLYLLGAE